MNMALLQTVESWKPIMGYEGLYAISSWGRVRSFTREILRSDGRRMRRNGRILKPYVSEKGYLFVCLCGYGEQINYRVHRLVAQAFIPNLDDLPQINHLDYDKANNRVSNLEWCDSARNNQHSAKKPGRKWAQNRLGVCGKLHPLSKPVFAEHIATGIVTRYESQNLAALATNSRPDKISACCLGRIRYHNGFVWRSDTDEKGGG